MVDLLRAPRYKSVPPLQRIFAYLDTLDFFACWEWTGGLSAYGYARISIARKRVPAHRVVYELLIGPIPDGYVIDHLCRVRHCLNPLHLEPVPNVVNVLRGMGPNAINARKTECAWGHPFTESNTKIRKNGHRQCRRCHNEGWKRAQSA